MSIGYIFIISLLATITVVKLWYDFLNFNAFLATSTVILFITYFEINVLLFFYLYSYYENNRFAIGANAMNTKDRNLIINTLTFWDNLNEIEKNLILNNITSVNYQLGEHIHSSGTDCIGVLIIKSGGIRTYILSEDGRDITLYRLSAGDICILSASCILENITFAVHIDAEVDSEAFLISTAIFEQLYRQNIYVENFAYKDTIDRFSDVMWAMQQILFMSFDKRLAIFLLKESTNTNSATLHLSHEQIAKYISSAREVVSRMLKYFANEGIVKLARGEVTLLDKTKLKKLLV
ncbi:MAG: transcriptional regulator Crp/Fnr family [Massilibacillus sp.]|nr:transcriptional regulator Crp/Fnr family [Massilibacillus sp.]